jgi:hypothetical protein
VSKKEREEKDGAGGVEGAGGEEGKEREGEGEGEGGEGGGGKRDVEKAGKGGR